METEPTEPASSVPAPESERDEAATTESISSVVVPKSEWTDFVTGLERKLRIVPEVSQGSLVGIRCFYVNAPQAARIGLATGDRLVAVNGTPVRAGGRDAAAFLEAEMQRSATTCSLRFTVEHEAATRTLAAHCE